MGIYKAYRRGKGEEKFDIVIQSGFHRFCFDYPEIVDLTQVKINITVVSSLRSIIYTKRYE